MIERFHRTLKAAFTCTGGNWAENLPLILLALRNTVKEDLNTTPAELVYGETLCLPGDFFTDSPPIEQTTVVSHLRETISKLRPTPASNHATNSRPFVFQQLRTCTHVYTRRELAKTALTPAYEGPFKVISRSPKTFKISIKGQHRTVSIDRLKPAYTLENTLATPVDSTENSTNSTTNDDQPISTRTRSGRTVTLPQRHQ